MPRHLSHITNPINSYLASRFAVPVKNKIGFSNGKYSIHPVLNTAFLQGEALLRLQFFAALKDKHIEDPENQNKYWQLLVEDKRHIQQVAEHSSISKYFVMSSTEKDQESGYAELCYAAFCIVLWDMHEHDNSPLANRTVKGFVSHFLPQLFPKQPSLKDPETIKKEIARQLYLLWGERPEIKESFITTDDKVEFTLLAKLKKHSPVTLLCMQGKRLKPTRLKSCARVLELLEMGALKIENPAEIPPNKNQKPQPFGK